MSNADDLLSSDPAEESLENLSRENGLFKNSQPGSRTHSRQSSLSRPAGSQMSRSPSVGSSSSSVLGRRQRDLESPPLTYAQKVHIREYAAERCAEYGIAANERSAIIRDSQRPLRELIVSLRVELSHNKALAQEDTLLSYIKKPAFKDNIVLKLRAMLLDPNISSYKSGVMERVMRHIRLNASTIYKVPLEIQDLVASSGFGSAISKVLTNHRSLMKSKLASHATAKSDIYTLVKDLKPNTAHESSDEMWSRWAWVHLMFSDFIIKLKEPSSKLADKDFWDWLDGLLAARRAKYAEMTFPTEKERITGFNSLFDRSLTKHKSKFPPTIKPQSGRPPPWQKAVAKAVLEMEAYTQEDLADGALVDDGDDDGEEHEQSHEDSNNHDAVVNNPDTEAAASAS